MNRQRLLTELKSLLDEEYREEYQRSLVQIGVSAQIRALRGSMSQKEFAELIEVPQSVVSERLENPHYSGLNTSSLVNVANKLQIGLLVRFVPFPELLERTQDTSEAALKVPSLRESIDIITHAPRVAPGRSFFNMNINIAAPLVLVGKGTALERRRQSWPPRPQGSNAQGLRTIGRSISMGAPLAEVLTTYKLSGFSQNP